MSINWWMDKEDVVYHFEMYRNIKPLYIVVGQLYFKNKHKNSKKEKIFMVTWGGVEEGELDKGSQKVKI